MNKKIISGISFMGVSASCLAGTCSADDYEYEADFICPNVSCLPKELIETIKAAIKENGKIGFEVGAMKSDEAQIKEPYAESTLSNLFKECLLEINKKRMENIKKIAEERDVFRKAANQCLKFYKLENYLPFLPWDNFEKVEKYITEKEPNFFSLDYKYSENLNNIKYLKGDFLTYDEAVKSLIFDYAKYLAVIDNLKQELKKSDKDRMFGNFLLPKNTIKKRMASYWIAKNIVEIELKNREKELLKNKKTIKVKNNCNIF